jgi:hypothetical protein
MRKVALRAKRRPAMSAEEKRQAREFYEVTVKGQRCAACGADERTARARGTRLIAHHVLTQQQLRRHGHIDKRWCPENGLALCDYPCHSRHTTRVEPIPRSALPKPALEFAMSLGLGWLLERQYPA